MSTELVVKSSMLPVQRMDDLIGIGQMIAKSGMFGIRNPAEGFIVAATCHQQRISLMEFKETYHIIQVTPSKRADSMLAQFIELGGEYEVVSRTPDKAEIKARFRSAAGTFSLTWEEAQKEPFVYVGKEASIIEKIQAGRWKDLMMKPKYATPRSRMQMLWSRVISDGVRTMESQVCSGIYTPEEYVADTDADDTSDDDIETVELPEDAQDDAQDDGHDEATDTNDAALDAEETN
jgi:hypothetical protein